MGLWGEKSSSSSSSSSIFFLGPLRACPAGAEVRWLQAGHTRKRLRLGSAKEPLRALPAPPSRSVYTAFSLLADELIHLPHEVAGVVLRPHPRLYPNLCLCLFSRRRG